MLRFRWDKTLLVLFSIASILSITIFVGLFDKLQKFARQLLLFGSWGGLAWYLVDYLAIRRLPDVSDDEFLERLGPSGRIPRDVLLAARWEVADALMVPPEKLSPDLRPSDLGSRFGIIRYLGDVYDDLEVELRSVGLKPPDRYPETIGGLVMAFAQVARLRQSTGSNPESKTMD